MKIRSLALVVLLLFGMSSLVVSCGESSSENNRVIVLALDGVDPHTVDLLMSEGKMPNFAKLKREGAYAPLMSQKPLLSPVIWTTVATGKTPDQHRIGHFVAVNPQTGEELPVTSQMRQSKALWNLFSENDRSVAVTGWWATWPAETVNGVVVSDHLAYHFLFDEGLEDSKKKDSIGNTFPKDLVDEIEPLVVRPNDIGPDVVSRYLDVTPETLEKPFDFEDPVAHFRWAWSTSETYKNIGLKFWNERDPDNLLVYIEGVDSTSHLFGHVFRNETLAGELGEQKKLYGRAVEQMYLYADSIVGEYLDAMDDDTTLIVLSDHGFDLGVVPDDPSMTRDFRRVSEKYHRLRGILYMYGKNIRRGSINQPSILDITPTVLALNGIPAAGDMPGRVLSEALTIEELPRIASYEAGGGTVDQTVSSDPAVDDEVMEKLRSLGYLGATSPNSELSLAGVLFEQGRFDEALAAYQKLVEASPEDASLRASYAGALGQLGHYDQALEQLEVAIRLKPLNPEAYHNRGVIHERRGNREEAVESYRTALRYGDFQPSRDALLKMGETPRSNVSTEPAHVQATSLAEQAAAAARRGDYIAANAMLDEAEKIAPELVLVHQYRSNVAYLMGDIDKAIAALEKGIALEPDNVLFRQNLATLKEQKGSNSQ